MQSKATTVAAYLASLPPDRRAALSAIRDVIRANLDRDYEEGMGYGMMGWSVPHRVFPPGYHCDPKQPVPFAGLASQKNYMSIYLMGAYYGRDCDADGETEESLWFRKAWLATGKKLDMGKCCVRFRKLEDVPLEVVGEAIRRVPVKVFIARYLEMLESIGKMPAGMSTSSSSAKPAAPKATTATRKSARTPKKVVKRRAK